MANQPDQSQPNRSGQQGQGSKLQEQHEQQQNSTGKQVDQQDQKGHPPGLTQGDNPDRPDDSNS